MARGNIAYSVGLMTLLMVVTIIYLPIVLPLLLPGESLGYCQGLDRHHAHPPGHRPVHQGPL